MKPGYLYVLMHPSDPDLYKIGATILHPEERLVQDNRLFDEYPGQVVKETGQEWELKTYIAVPDPNWAKVVFWGATGLAEIPYRSGIEVETMKWSTVQAGLDAVKKAGVRPPKKKPRRDRDWMVNQLEGSGLALIGTYRGLLTRVEFQCGQGHVFKESPGLVANRKWCPRCMASQT